MSAAERAERRKELAKIHLGARQLGLADGAYRDLLEAVGGQRSAKDLDAAGRRRALAQLRSLGADFRPPPRDEDAPPVREAAEAGAGEAEASATAPLQRKIRALLGTRPEAYAEAILQRQTGHPHRTPLAWASAAQLRKVVAALTYDRQRRERKRSA